MSRRAAGIAALSILLSLVGCSSDELVYVFETTTSVAATTEADSTVLERRTDDGVAEDASSRAAGASTTATSLVVSTTTSEVSEFPDEYDGQLRHVDVVGDVLPPLTNPHIDEAVGMSIPQLIGEDYDGNDVSFGPEDGVATLVVFLAHWCPHCNNEVPEINLVRDADAWPAGLRVIGVSTAVAPDRPNFPPQRWLVEKDWTYPVIADAIDFERATFVAGEAYGVTGFPFMTLVDEQGKVRGRWSGEIGADGLVSLVSSLLDPPADA